MPKQDLWSYVRPEGSALAVGGAALLVSTFSNAFAPRAMGRVVDAYARRRRDAGASLRRELVTTGLVFGCGALASGVRTACFANACQGALRRLRGDVYRACLVRRRAARDGAAADAVDADAAAAAKYLTEGLQNGLRYASSLLNGGARLCLLSPHLALELLVALPLGAGLVRLAARGVARRGDAAERADRAALALARDRLRPEALDVVRSCGAEAVERRAFGDLLARAEDAGRTHGRARGCLMGSLDAVGKLTVLGVVFRGGARVESGDMSGGDLLAFALYAAYAALGLAGLARVALGDRRAFQRAEARLLAALDADVDRAATAAATDVPPGGLAVEFAGVDVAYAGRDERALRGVSFAAHAGRVTGVVGASGAGKSTLLKCCAGLVLPTAGTVRVCGVDVAGGGGRVAALRRALTSVVQQGAPLLAHGPRLVDAVTYLGLAAPLDAAKARRACHAARADVVLERVGGLEGDVGRDACELSGGQKNRVALARALYREGARVLLLDEPTAALDAGGEAAVLDGALGAAKRRGCAVVVVAHSRAAIARCDDVVVLERGRLVESGPYQTLAADAASRLNALLE